MLVVPFIIIAIFLARDIGWLHTVMLFGVIGFAVGWILIGTRLTVVDD